MAESVEKLEDVIVRSAEQVSGQIRAAKDAIATVIFGQDRVIENTLVTILSGVSWATCSMSMPPSVDTTMATRERARSTSIER